MMALATKLLGLVHFVSTPFRGVMYAANMFFDHDLGDVTETLSRCTLGAKKAVPWRFKRTPLACDHWPTQLYRWCSGRARNSLRNSYQHFSL